MCSAEAAPVSAAEAQSLFADLKKSSGLVLAVSGGPDSTALLWLAARWRDALKSKPPLLAITIDHALRAESKREADAVRRLAQKLGVPHRTLRWSGKKPAAGLPQAARAARYRLLAAEARRAGASHILTAHTLDDQAETVLIRMSRGSGITGLAAMARDSDLGGHVLSRPLLDIPKVRLLATLSAAGIAFADDPTNRDPRFTRARLRGGLMATLAQEGLDARRLGALARRLRRSDAAIEAAVDRTEKLAQVRAGAGAVGYAAAKFSKLPDEIALRLLGRAIARLGDEGPVELGKLEALSAALAGALAAQKTDNARFRRTLAGAVVTLAKGRIAIEKAPARRKSPLTTRKHARARGAKAG